MDDSESAGFHGSRVRGRIVPKASPSLYRSELSNAILRSSANLGEDVQHVRTQRKRSITNFVHVRRCKIEKVTPAKSTRRAGVNESCWLEIALAMH